MFKLLVLRARGRVLKTWSKSQQRPGEEKQDEGQMEIDPTQPGHNGEPRRCHRACRCRCLCPRPRPSPPASSFDGKQLTTTCDFEISFKSDMRFQRGRISEPFIEKPFPLAKKARTPRQQEKGGGNLPKTSTASVQHRYQAVLQASTTEATQPGNTGSGSPAWCLMRATLVRLGRQRDRMGDGSRLILPSSHG